MTYPLNLGFDRGNARTNVATATGNDFVEIDASSMIGNVNLTRMKNINAGAGKDVIETDDMVLFHDGKHYIFDDYALKQGVNPTTGFGDENRYHGPHTQRSLMAYSSLMASKVASSKYGMPTDISLNLVMGVPVNFYRQEAEKVKAALEGKTFKYQFNDRDVTLAIPSVRVFMEGAGAAICHGLDNSGYVAIVDTGSFTTNALVFDGMKPVYELCQSYELGIGTALKMVSEQVENKYGRGLDDREKEQLLRSTIGLDERPFVIAGEVEVSGAELYEWMIAALNDTAHDIYTRISGLWKNRSKQFKATLHVGGGSYYLDKQFQERFSRAHRPKESEKYNARGYAILAQQIAERNAKLHVVRKGA